MRVPFPTIESNLAVCAYMYLCLDNGEQSKLLSCQTDKPLLLLDTRPPYHYVKERNDPSRNPFKHETLTACDYAFLFKKIVFADRMHIRTRPDVSKLVFEKVQATISFPEFGLKLV